MDEKKALGAVLALGKAIGEEARENPDLIKELRTVETREELEAFALAHRGKLPEGLCREWVQWIPEDRFVKERARLIIQAKTVAAGQKPAGPQHGQSGGIRPG